VSGTHRSPSATQSAPEGGIFDKVHPTRKPLAPASFRTALTLCGAPLTVLVFTLTHAAAIASPPSPPPDGRLVVLNALKAELQRSKEKLALPDEPGAYFIR
jgi:hypothetical protein